MSTDGSISRWVGQLKSGDAAAVERLWERYFPRLVGLARKRLLGAAQLGADEEDVALSAFASFCRGAEEGRFPALADRDGLWRLLVTLTARKATRKVRAAARQKRGGATQTADTNADLVLAEVLSREPTPEFAAEMEEELRRLLGRLDDKALAAVALARMEGYSVDEVADRLGCAPRSVKRKLALIRTIWEKEMAG